VLGFICPGYELRLCLEGISNGGRWRIFIFQIPLRVRTLHLVGGCIFCILYSYDGGSTLLGKFYMGWDRWDGRTHGWMDERMNGWKDGRTGGSDMGMAAYNFFLDYLYADDREMEEFSRAKIR
jgi:hypothetical protein